MGKSSGGPTSSSSNREAAKERNKAVQGKLRCLYTNIDGLNKLKGGELSIALRQEEPHIVFVTETKLHEDQTLTQFTDCSGYNVFRKDRSTGQGGGVLMLVRNDITAHEYNDKAWEDIEAVACKLKLGQYVMILASIYRPPNADVCYNDCVRSTLQLLGSQQEQVMVCGDFNFPQINWHQNKVHGGDATEQGKFFEACQDAFLHQHVQSFTRVRGSDRPSLLDLILTKNPLEVEDLKYHAPYGASDHCVLNFDMLVEGTDPSQPPEMMPRKNYFKGNYEKASRMFEAVNWEDELKEKTVEEAWDLFKKYYNSTVDKCVPLCPSSSGGCKRKKKWMTRSVMEDIRKKEESWKKYRKRKTPKHLQRYKKLRNKATRSVREAKYKFELELAREVKTNPKAFYAYARNKTTIKEQVVAVKNEQGEISSSVHETCEIMNEQFQKVFVRSDEPVPYLPNWNGEKLTTIAVSPEDVTRTLRDLKPSAPGPDGVHPVVLKNCASSLSRPLTIIFTESLKTGSVPRDWKRANVTPIFKKGSRVDPLNYRPISLTSVPCKIMEKIVRKHLMCHLESSNYLTQAQHGFRSGMSCLTQLLEYLFELENAMDDGDSVDSIYLDCSKAFDTVPHAHLLAKLRAAGVEGQVAGWISAFLMGREQRVGIRGIFSRWRSVWSGVPQGSVMGPTLFLVYVNDLLDGLKSDGKLFADDAKIFRRIKSCADKQILQEDLDRLQEWSDKWLLKFNSTKCKVMNFGSRSAKYTYSMGGAQLANSEQERDLGVLVVSSLKPSTQVCRAAASANSMLGRIRSAFTCLDEKTLPPLYKALVRPRMEFAIQAWSPYLKKDIKTLEKVQRRATKLVPALTHLPYEARLETLGLTTLLERRARGDMIETYKIIEGHDKVRTRGTFLELDENQNRTRGHNKKLTKPRHRTMKRTKFFPARVVDLWNSLPEHVVNSRSVNEFKRRYDRHISQRSTE